MIKVKKILLIAPKFHSVNRTITSLLEIKYKIKVFEHPERYPEFFFARLFFKSLELIKLGFVIEFYNRYLNRKIVELYHEFKPDIVIVIKGHKITKESILEMEKSKNFLWMMDDFNNVENFNQNAQFYDNIIVFDEENFESLSKNEVSCIYAPLALDNQIYKKLVIEKKFDVTFIGSLNKYRLDVFKNVIDEFGNLNINIFGKLSSYRLIFYKIRIKFSKYKKNFVFKDVSAEESNIIYNQSKVVINLHQNKSKSGTNLRFFEIIGSGTIQIVNEKKFISENFGELVVTFNNTSDLIKVLAKVLSELPAHLEKLEKIRNIVYKKHTFSKRLEMLANSLFE